MFFYSQVTWVETARGCCKDSGGGWKIRTVSRSMSPYVESRIFSHMYMDILYVYGYLHDMYTLYVYGYVYVYVYEHTCFKWMCWFKLGPRWLWWATVFNNFHRALRVDGAFDGQNNPIQAHKSGGGFWFPWVVLGNAKKTYKHRYKTSKDILYSKR